MCAVNYPRKQQGDAERVGFRLPLVRTRGWCQVAPGGVDVRVQIGVIEEPTEPLLGSMIMLVLRQVNVRYVERADQPRFKSCRKLAR